MHDERFSPGYLAGGNTRLDFKNGSRHRLERYAQGGPCRGTLLCVFTGNDDDVTLSDRKAAKAQSIQMHTNTGVIQDRVDYPEGSKSAVWDGAQRNTVLR